VDLEDAPQIAGGAGLEEQVDLSLPLRLAPSTDPWRAVTATVVPFANREWLARMLYALPPNTLAALKIAVGEDRFYLIDPSGIEGVPLGTFHSEVASRIYVPSGLTLVPAVSPAVLQDLVSDRGDGYVFFDPQQEAPRVVPAAAFGPVSRRVLREVAAVPLIAEPLSGEEPGLPLLRYEEPRRFPLWGVPMKNAEIAPDPEEIGDE
jgi:hypothetical protein